VENGPMHQSSGSPDRVSMTEPRHCAASVAAW
jgi:hypothetical protein